MLVNALICSERIFTIPTKKVGKFLIGQKNDERFYQQKDVTQDKLQLVLIEFMKANTQALNIKNNQESHDKNLATSPSIKRKTPEDLEPQENSIDITSEFVVKV